MPKFLVRVGGDNFKFHSLKKKWFFWKSLQTEIVGFYTTRFIETDTQTEGIEKVLELVMSEMQENGQVTKDSKLEVDEIREDERGYDLYNTGGGFSFFVMDE